jgi:hypothetical protein
MTMRIIGIDLAVNAKHKAMILDPASNEFLGKVDYPRFSGQIVRRHVVSDRTAVHSPVD